MHKIIVIVLLLIALGEMITLLVFLLKDHPFFKLALARLKSDSPEFFVTIRKFFSWLGGACLAILVAKNFLTGFGFDLPSMATTILGYTVCACAAIAGTTFLTTKDHGLIERPTLEMGGANGNS